MKTKIFVMAMLTVLIFYYNNYLYSEQDGIRKRYEVIKIDYDTSGAIKDKFTEIIYFANKKIDVKFIALEFNLQFLFDLPKSFINKKYKNDTITYWLNKTQVKTYHSNSTKTLIYDSLSRIINFSWSGCHYCSRSYYEYEVNYNDLYQIESLTWHRVELKYEFIYDSYGDIRQMNTYKYDKLIESLILNKKELTKKEIEWLEEANE